MQNTDSENSSSDEQKKQVGRPRTSLWRYENGKYNDKPNSETYFNDYYHEKLSIKVECPHCQKLVVKQTLGRHITTVKKCFKKSKSRF